MHTASASREIDAPVEDVWRVLDDFGGVAKYNPSVERSSIVDGPDTGVGSTRECVFYDGGRIEEEIVDYDPGAGYTVDFVDTGDLPLKHNQVEITVRAAGETRTVVTMRSTFEPKFGPLGWIVAKAMMESRFREVYRDVLAALESHVRTGRAVGEDGVLLDAASD